MSKHLEGYLRATLGLVQLFAVLELERQVMVLRAFPWINDLHWRLTLRIHELLEDEQRLLKARAILQGESYRRVPIEPPERPVAPSEQVSAAAAGFVRVLELAKGE